MELKSIGQGGQVSFETVRGVDKSYLNSSADIKVQAGDNTENEDMTMAPKDKDINEKDIKKAVDKLNKFLEDDKTHAEYEVHDKLKDIMIKIIDDKTGKVIQEFPPKKILDMVAKMCEMVGILFDKKA